MKTKRLILVAAALILISGFAVKPAIAYFTDTDTANGVIELTLGDGKLPEMEDKVEHMIKTISISNTGDYDVLIRAKAIYPDSCTVTLQESTGWTKDGDYYYYKDVISPTGNTEPLNLKIDYEGTDDSFNVIIIQEAAKAIYDDDGNATADWSSAIISSSDEAR